MEVKNSVQCCISSSIVIVIVDATADQMILWPSNSESLSRLVQLDRGTKRIAIIHVSDVEFIRSVIIKHCKYELICCHRHCVYSQVHYVNAFLLYL